MLWNRFIPGNSLVIVLCFICSNVNCQRIVKYEDFPSSYFDSIRNLVYDSDNENYTISAYRLSEVDGEISIDGKLTEPAWSKAQHRGGFLEKEPFPLVPISEETEFAILYDDQNLYIGVWCWDSEPDKIVRELSPRGTSAPDHVQLFVDSYHDHRTGFKFTVSPTGVQVDELRFDDVKRDHNWNGVWYSEGFVDERGWYTEVKIPFFNFRYKKLNEQTWGFNIIRNISKNASRGQWKPHLPEWDNTTRMSQLGDITNIYNISSGKKFEFRPYGVLGFSKTVDEGTSGKVDIGGDVRYRPSPNLTADFTINPDFAQIDADVYEINLTRFPTRFKELRPFFTERINIFNTPMELFYSRRIGIGGSILGGGKLTGKLKNGIEFGTLINQTGSGLFSDTQLNDEKATFAVFRGKKDILGSGSIGFLGALKEQPDQFNRILGIDGNFMLDDNDLFDFQAATATTEQNNDQNKAFKLIYLHTGDLFGVKTEVERTESGFEINRIGYIQKEPDRGWNRGALTFRISPRINRHHIRRIITNVLYEYNQDLITSKYINTWLGRHPAMEPHQNFGEVIHLSNGERIISNGARSAFNHLIGGDLTFNLLNEMSVSAMYQYYMATELTGKYRGDLLKLEYATRPLNLGAKVAGTFSLSGGEYYNFAQQYPGSQRGLTVLGQGRLGPKILTKLQGGYTKTYDNAMKIDGQFFNLSSNTTWMFTKDFFLRLHIQGIAGTTWYDHKESHNNYLMSCLISWQYQPGSFMYLGYNEGRINEKNPMIWRRFEFNNRTLIFKMSYFFSL